MKNGAHKSVLVALAVLVLYIYGTAYAIYAMNSTIDKQDIQIQILTATCQPRHTNFTNP